VSYNHLGLLGLLGFVRGSTRFIIVIFLALDTDHERWVHCPCLLDGTIRRRAGRRSLFDAWAATAR
jgi:hypothetical protein